MADQRPGSNTKRRGPYKANLSPSRTTRWRNKKQKIGDVEDLSSESFDNGDDIQCDLDIPLQISNHVFNSEEGDSTDKSSVRGEDIAEDDILNYDQQFADDEEDDVFSDSDTEDDSSKDESGGMGGLGGFFNLCDFEKPIFEGSRITLCVSILLIMVFSMRHGLSGEGLKDLLVLIELHCITPNLCGQSVKFLKDFFMRLRSPVQLHYICGTCSNYFGQTKTTHCSACGKEDISYFLVIPLITQLQSFFAQPGFMDLLQYPLKRQKGHGIEDIYDGQLYKDLFCGQHFHGTPLERRSSEIHISFQLNTDGVSLFRSSNFSVWPLYMTINELPPKSRLSRQYRIFAGLWFGTCKPEMCTYLKPLVEELLSLEKGINIISDNRTFLLRAALVCVVCDSPARCTVQNFIQFNGYYGCATCKIKGTQVQTSEMGSTTCFPFTDSPDLLQQGHPEERTHNESLESALKAETDAQTHFGVKGYSPLYKLPRFNIIRGVTIDYMHCVLLGVVKMFLHLWLDTKNKDKPFYIRKFLSVLNSRILSIRPPKAITRAPSSFIELANWKASEYRSFLLFYFVPCMYDILPTEYYVHYLLLVEAIHILLKSSITGIDVKWAKVKLIKFCASVEYLYGPRYETSNVHALLHLCKKVEDLGPLHFHSCFFFEDLNKDLRSFFHGTQNTELQITLAVAIHQQIPKLVDLIPRGTGAERLYNQMTKRYSVKNQVKIGQGKFAIGPLKNHSLPHDITKKILDIYGVMLRAQVYFRLIVDGHIFHSQDYTRVTRRISYVVKYKSYNKVCYGAVQFYLKCSFVGKEINLAIIKPYSISQLKNGVTGHLPPFMLSVEKSCELELIPVENLIDVCVFMSVKGIEQDIMAEFPNLVEGD